MKHAAFLFAIMFMSLLSSNVSANNLPRSRQASFVESYSPSEVTIKATGIGKKTKYAIMDARKAAVFFVLLLGTDPALKTQEEKNKFEAIQEDFFSNDNIMKYISWEATKVISAVKIRTPIKGRKITKMIRVNKKLLIDDLVGRGIMMSQTDIADAIGNPFIMVIPEAPKGQTPLQVLDKNPLAKHSASVIESYLTAHKYDVQVPQASDQLTNQIKMQAGIKGVEEDVGYQLALAIGCDVYIVYAGRVSQEKMGKKASLTCKAYETTTARLLGTETGYSHVRDVADEVLIEEAMNDAIEKVMSRVRSYWQDDLKKGLQYKLIFKISGDFDEDQLEDIQGSVGDMIDDMFARSKENVVSEKTMDYLVWAKKDDYKRASKIYRKFRKGLPKKESDVKVTKISINRKLLIMEIKEAN